MAETAALSIKVSSKGVKQATKELDRLGKESKSATKSVGGLTKAFAGLGAIVGAGTIFKSVISATIEQERVQAQLRNTIESTGMAAGHTAEELFDMAAGLQQVTTFGDEAIIGAQDLLLTFTKIGEETFPNALEAVLNVSTAMGTDLKSAALQVGKALNDPKKGLDALSRSGIQFTDTQRDLIKNLVETGREADAQRIILEELETQFGNSARAARDTFGGAVQSLKNTFGDLLEGGGGNLTDAKDAINELNETLKDPAVIAGISAITNGVITLTSAFVEAAAASANFTKFLGEELGSIVGGPAADDVVRLNEHLDELKENLAGAKGDNLLGVTSPQWVIDGINEEIAATERLIQTAQDLSNAEQHEQQKKNLEARKKATEAKTEEKSITATLTAEYTKNTESTRTNTDALLEQKRALEELERIEQRKADRAAQIFEDTRTELERFTTAQKELNTLYEQGFLDTDTYGRALEQLGGQIESVSDVAEQQTSSLDDFAKTAQERIQGDIADVLTGKFTGSFDDILDGWTDLLIRMAAEAAAAQITESLFGGSSGGGGSGGGAFGAVADIFGSFFAGAKDRGGFVPAGQFAIAGERGPEIVTGPANVTSTKATAKQSGGNVINISLPGIQDARQAREASGQLQRAVGRAVSGAARYQ